MDTLKDNNITELFNTIFSPKEDDTLNDNGENFDKAHSEELFSLIETNKSSKEQCIETSISISSHNYIFSHKSILKIIEE